MKPDEARTMHGKENDQTHGSDVYFFVIKGQKHMNVYECHMNVHNVI